MIRNKGELVFQTFNAFLLAIPVLLIVLPFIHIISVSISSTEAVNALSVGLIPKGINFKAYGQVLKGGIFYNSLLNTVFITIITTASSLIVNIMSAYGFSREFYGKKFFTYYLVITMYFSGGLIPTYILMTKWLNLYNNYLAFILPSLVSVFYIIVIKSQIEAIPQSLREAAIIDGANEFQVLFYVIFPALSATIAAIGMFIALGMWNMWYPVMLYSNKREMWSLQYYLRAIVFERSSGELTNNNVLAVSEEEIINPVNLQMASIILVALPIVSIYPFVQKYFVKGMLAGSVKG